MWSLLGGLRAEADVAAGIAHPIATVAGVKGFSRDVLRAGSAYREGYRRSGDSLVKLTLDLHDMYNRGRDIDRALRDIMDEAVRKKAPLVEIIPGKGSGQLKKHVLRFLQQKEIKALYHRVEKDSKNFGRVFVHFRW
jgi:DNA-nicking Smr family endonuclease